MTCGAATAYQLVDTFSWIRGKHSLKFGFDYRWNGLNWRVGSGPAQFTFSRDVTGLPGFNQTGHGFASMLLGQVTSASVPVDHAGRFAVPDVLVVRAGRLEGQPESDPEPRRPLGLSAAGYREVRPSAQLQSDSHRSEIRNSRARSSLPGKVRAAMGSGFSIRQLLEMRLGSQGRLRVSIAGPGLFKNMTIRGGIRDLLRPRIPNGWSGVPWGNKLGFTATNTVNQPAPNTAAFNWDNGYNGAVKNAGSRSFRGLLDLGTGKLGSGRRACRAIRNSGISTSSVNCLAAWFSTSAISARRALDCRPTSFGR